MNEPRVINGKKFHPQVDILGKFRTFDTLLPEYFPIGNPKYGSIWITRDLYFALADPNEHKKIGDEKWKEYQERLLFYSCERKARGEHERRVFGMNFVNTELAKDVSIILEDENSITRLLPINTSIKLTEALINLYTMNAHDLFKNFVVDEDDAPFFYASSLDEIGCLIDYYVEEGYLKQLGRLMGGSNTLSWTIKGLEYVESIIPKWNSKGVFIAMQFKDNDDLFRGIEESVKACGYKAVRVDQEQFQGGIADQILLLTKQSRFIIAEFSNENRNVYYEAGYGMGCGKVVIPICRKDVFDKKTKENTLGFDIMHINFILYNDIEELKVRLTARINALFGS